MSPASRERPTPSCARCYLMKKKCDKKVPSCSRCVQARTPCQGIHRSNKTKVPRSAVQYLENYLAQGENGLLSKDSQHSNVGGAEQVHRPVLYAANIAFGSVCTTSVLQNNPGIHYAARLFYASERPPLKIPVRGVYNEEPPRMASRGAIFRLSETGARTIPIKVAEKLFENYLKNVLPRYPCFLESDLVYQFNIFYRDTNISETPSSDSTCFIVSMILAISSLTSKSHEFWKVASLSEALQRDALNHATFLGRTSFRSLQCFLLLIQLSLWLPYTANLWYMSGEAMRMAIALGLHQDMDDPSIFDPTQLSLRRNVFWTIYHLERTIAIASGCPLAISDEHITTQMPSNMNSLAPSNRGLNQFLSHVQLSRIQSEILGVQFFDQALPQETPDYGDWIRKSEVSVQTWQECLAVDGDIPGWSIVLADHCRLLLYRPCSRNMVPDESCLRAATAVATRTIHGHWATMQTGSLIFALQYVYYVFQASMVLLYALGNHGPEELGSVLEAEARDAIELLPSLFETLSARWPAASDTGHYVKELKDTVLRKIQSGELPGRSAHDTNLLAELDFLVTQRRIHSVYHRNVEISRPEQRIHSDTSPWASADPYTPLSDEMWRELINTTFEFFADDSLTFPEPGPELEPEPEPGRIEAWNYPEAQDTSMMEHVDADSIVDVELLIRSIPACGYCRSRHVKCDQKFPACGACTRSDRQCVYYDAVLEIDIPRSYVYGLYENYRATSNRNSTKGLLRTTGRSPGRFESMKGVLLPIPAIECIGASHGHGQNQDIRCPLDAWFFGCLSVFVTLKTALALNPELTLIGQHNEPWLHHEPMVSENFTSQWQMPPQSALSALLRFFSGSINLFYPTVKDDQLNSLTASGSHQSDMTDQDQDIFFLILAISSKLVKAPAYVPPFASHVYFHKATYHPAKTRESWLQLDPLLLLQRQLLICIYLILSPASGDIWRNLGFAIRLYFDLSHRPSENDDTDEELMIMLFRTLYCLECQVAIAFGRPSLLVIGDKLREVGYLLVTSRQASVKSSQGITQSLSRTIEERVSSFFYRISLLKMQIHSTILSRTGIQPHHSMTTDDCQIYQQDLDAWLTDWKEEVISNIESHSETRPQLLPILEAWANLNYHHTGLLITHLSPSSSDNVLQHTDQIILSSATLVRYQQKSLLLPVPATVPESVSFNPIFPLNWTIAHTVFSIGLNIPDLLKRSGPSRTYQAREVATRCLTVLAMFESEFSMLSTGFSEILEWLGSGEEV